MAATVNGQRRPNFSSAEEESLVSQVEKRKGVLFASFNSNVTKNMKDREWGAVADALSRISTTRRTVPEIKMKWKNIKSKTKQIVSKKMSKSSINKTGGGPPLQTLSSSDIRMLGIVGTDSIIGIEGGFDSSCLDEPDLNNSQQLVLYDRQIDEPDLNNSQQLVLYDSQIAMKNQRPTSSTSLSAVSIPTTSLSILNTTPNSGIVSAGSNANPIPNDGLRSAGSNANRISILSKPPRIGNNTKLVNLQQQILDELKGLKDISKERLDIDKERLELERQRLKIEIEKSKHPPPGSYPHYILKVDDDIFINVERLLEIIHDAAYAQMIGRLTCGASPVSDVNSKFYMPNYLYSCLQHLGYLSGTAYLLRGDIVPILLENVLTAPLIHLEDIYISALIARKSNIFPQDSLYFTFNRINPKTRCAFKFLVSSN